MMQKTTNKAVTVGSHNLSVEEIVKVAREYMLVSLDEASRKKIKEARQTVEEIILEEKTVYGINTGFGNLCDVVISKDKRRELQSNLIAGHAAGVGTALDQETVRAIMLLRINTLAVGHSGVREEVIDQLIEMLNRKVHPVIPSQGSLGASGDLAPLSHMALALTGKGEAFWEGKRLNSNEALKAAGLEPIELKEKEGLALINGTQVMTALGALAFYDAVNLVKTADITGSLTMEALKARKEAFDLLTYRVRPHPGHGATLRNLHKLCSESLNIGNGTGKLQDAYSIRCLPQVHGATKDTLHFVKSILETEINSVTDNPLIFPEENRVISAGNFHGQPLALAMDYFSIALSELGSITERRLERLLNNTLSGLPPFLTNEKGLNSGYMIAHYTAASLASENKVLSHPACTDSLPVSANQEDHVSMGTHGARKAVNVINNVSYIIAIEYLAAVQALDLSDNQGLGLGTRKAYGLLREHVPFLEKDRVLNLEIEKTASLIREGKTVQEVEHEILLEPVI